MHTATIPSACAATARPALAYICWKAAQVLRRTEVALEVVVVVLHFPHDADCIATPCGLAACFDELPLLVMQTSSVGEDM